MWLRWIAACDGEPTALGTDPLPTDPPADTADSATVPADCVDATWTGTSVTGSLVDQGDERDASCGGAGGGDVVYAFTAPADGTYVFDSVGSTADVVLAAFDGCTGAELACDDDGAGGLDALLRLALTSGQVVLVQVDGYDTSGGDYVVTVATAAANETDCTDGVDDDADRWIDCLDDDCAGAPRCAAQCPDAALDTVPASYQGSTLGEPDEHDSYCTDFGPNSDWTVGFTAPAPGRYLFEATGVGFGAVMSVREETCDDYEVWCTWPGSVVWFDLATGDTLYVDVTGQFGAAGPFTLDVTVHPSTETDCGDGQDDDIDFMWDCSDPDCDASDACVEDCVNGSDDDGDQRIDCADGGCADDPACVVQCPEGTLDGPLPVVVTSTTSGLTPNDAASCAPTGGASDETWSFTAPADGTYTFAVSGYFDPVLFLLDGCGGPELACDDDSGPDTGSLLSVALEAGHEVLVVVDGFDTESGEYTLTVSN